MSWEELVQRERAEKLLAEALEATPLEHQMPTGDVILECGHMLHFKTGVPHKKEILWCNRCKDEQRIADIATGKAYRVKCETCNYTRGKGGRIEADRASVSHRLKKPHHVVNLLDASGTIVHTFKDSEGVTTLPDSPPY